MTPASTLGSRRVLVPLLCLTLCGAAVALALGAGPAHATAHARRAAAAPADTTALLRSRLLWATIDVCNPQDQPDTVGVRGSMPGDRQSHDKMYMRFRLQYMSSTAKTWTDLSKASAEFTEVGSGSSARQAGRSFQLKPVTGQPPFMLRGVVSFQWRHGKTVLAQVSRTTSAGRQSLAGSDPAGFSAATCQIG